MRSQAERIFGRVQHALGFARTTTPPTDTGSVQTVQIKLNALTVRDGTPVLYHFGFAACLPIGSDVALVTVSGDTSNGAIVASNHQASRPTGLTPGQCALYDQAGSMLRLNNDGTATLLISGTPIATFSASGITSAVPVTAPDFVLASSGYTLARHEHDTPSGESTAPNGNA